MIQDLRTDIEEIKIYVNVQDLRQIHLLSYEASLIGWV